MRKEEFFRQLEYLLQDISDSEREEALAYYRDYLEEAGSGREEQVIEEFGSPERVAAIIRADLTDNLKDGGSFTEKGYEDERFRDPGYQVAKRLDLPEDWTEGEKKQEKVYEEPIREKKAEKPRTSRLLKGILWVVLLVAASPFLFGAAAIAFGAVTAVLGIGVGAVLLLLCLTAAAFIVSVCLVGFGIAFLATTPLDFLFLAGIAMVGIGCGLLGIVVLYVILGIICPLLWKGAGKLVKLLGGKRREEKRA